jgi:hypothetical protein
MTPPADQSPKGRDPQGLDAKHASGGARNAQAPNYSTEASAIAERLSTEPDYDAEMRLAPGVTCDDCAHCRRCFAFGFSKTGRTSCDFYPNRFLAVRTLLKDNQDG